MTDNALSNESTGSNRPNVSVLCYAVFPWTSDWEMLPNVRDALSGLYCIMFRINVFQFLTDDELICVKLCCKDAFEYIDLLDGPDLHEYDVYCESSDYDSE